MSVSFAFQDSRVAHGCKVAVEGVFGYAGFFCEFFAGECGCFLEDAEDFCFGVVFEEDFEDFCVFGVCECVGVVSAASGFFMNGYESFCGHCPNLVGYRSAGCTDCFDDSVELNARIFFEVCGYFFREGGGTRVFLFGLAVWGVHAVVLN